MVSSICQPHEKGVIHLGQIFCYKYKNSKTEIYDDIDCEHYLHQNKRKPSGQWMKSGMGNNHQIESPGIHIQMSITHKK
jgi:hypothetical protein